MSFSRRTLRILLASALLPLTVLVAPDRAVAAAAPADSAASPADRPAVSMAVRWSPGAIGGFDNGVSQCPGAIGPAEQRARTVEVIVPWFVDHLR